MLAHLKIDKDKYDDRDKGILRTPPIPETWNTDYNSNNWEPEFMTIFVTWQLNVTLDSIRNSCDVLAVYGSLWQTVATLQKTM